MTFIATKVDNQGDRVLIYGPNPNYYIIAPANTEVKEGDEIEYEPYGFNFGWFVEIVKP